MILRYIFLVSLIVFHLHVSSTMMSDIGGRQRSDATGASRASRASGRQPSTGSQFSTGGGMERQRSVASQGRQPSTGSQFSQGMGRPPSTGQGGFEKPPSDFGGNDFDHGEFDNGDAGFDPNGRQPSGMSQGGFGRQPSATSQGGFGRQPSATSQGGFGRQPSGMSQGGFGRQPSGMSQGGFGRQPSATSQGGFDRPQSVASLGQGRQPSAMSMGGSGGQENAAYFCMQMPGGKHRRLWWFLDSLNGTPVGKGYPVFEDGATIVNQFQEMENSGQLSEELNGHKQYSMNDIGEIPPRLLSNFVEYAPTPFYFHFSGDFQGQRLSVHPLVVDYASNVQCYPFPFADDMQALEKDGFHGDPRMIQGAPFKKNSKGINPYNAPNGVIIRDSHDLKSGQVGGDEFLIDDKFVPYSPSWTSKQLERALDITPQDNPALHSFPSYQREQKHKRYDPQQVARTKSLIQERNSTMSVNGRQPSISSYSLQSTMTTLVVPGQPTVLTGISHLASLPQPKKKRPGSTNSRMTQSSDASTIRGAPPSSTGGGGQKLPTEYSLSGRRRSGNSQLSTGGSRRNGTASRAPSTFNGGLGAVDENAEANFSNDPYGAPDDNMGTDQFGKPSSNMSRQSLSGNQFGGRQNTGSTVTPQNGRMRSASTVATAQKLPTEVSGGPSNPNGLPSGMGSNASGLPDATRSGRVSRPASNMSSASRVKPPSSVSGFKK